MPFRIALSGLNAATADLKVTGNNVANASTVGFKESRAEFSDVYAIAYQGISNISTGSGVRVAAVNQQFSQGNTDYTDRALDLTIGGKGFFTVKDADGISYTRAGQFGLDRDGYVTSNTGQRLQVFAPINNGTAFNTGGLTDLRLNGDVGAPNATTTILNDVNLDSNETVPLIAPFNPTDTATYNHSTAISVFDTLGQEHTAGLYYVKTAANNWDAYVSIPDGLGGTTESTAIPLVFDTSGNLTTINGVAAATSTAIDLNAAFGDTFPVNSGAANIQLSIDFDGSSQYGADFSRQMSQDGYTTGILGGFEVDGDGVVFANYSNGNSDVLGKVALANVANPQGLRPQGDTMWGATFAAGDVIYGEAGTSNLGKIQGGALESSNVNIAEELISLITAQRNFQANATVIKTADQVTQTLINLR